MGKIVGWINPFYMLQWDGKDRRISGFPSHFSYAKLWSVASTFPEGTVFALPDSASCSGDDFSPFFAISRGAFEGGFRLPMHPFVRMILKRADLAPGQLHPNFWRFVIAYVIHAQDCGLPPLAHIFMAIFGIRKIPNEVGIYTVQSGVKNPWRFPSNVSEYRTEWFLIRSPLVGPEYTSPRFLDPRSKPKLSKEKVRRLKARYLDSFDSQEDFDKIVIPVFLEMRGLSLSSDALREDFCIFIGDCDDSEAGLPSAAGDERPPVLEGSGAHSPPGRVVITVDDTTEAPTPLPSRSEQPLTEVVSPGRSSRPRKKTGRSSRKAKGKAVAESQPQPTTGSHVPVLLPGTQAEAFFSSREECSLPPIPTAVNDALREGVRGGAALSVLLIQMGMGLGELFQLLSGQEDALTDSQARARDFKSQLADSKKEAEKAKGELEATRGELKLAQENVARLEKELDDARERHKRELTSACERSWREGARDYIAGYRNRYRVDSSKAFNSGLLFRIFKEQARRQGLTNFRFDPNDFCGFEHRCPPYVPPPVGVFEDENDEDNPLEVWDVPALAPKTGIRPDKRNLLPPRPIPVPASSVTASGIRYERTGVSKR